MEGDLEARVQIRLADTVLPWVALATLDTVSAGRTAGYGLRMPHSWIPAKLCRFVPFDHGWVVQVGPRPRMRVQDRYVGDHVFERRALVALQDGTTKLSFPELDDWCEIGVVIGPDAAPGLPVAEDTVVEDDPRRPTSYAARRVVLTTSQRQTVAVAYQHLLTGAAKPVNVAVAAAGVLATTPQMVKKRLGQVRDKVNLERWGPDLVSHEQVAHYLMNLTRTITLDDLPADPTG